MSSVQSGALLSQRPPHLGDSNQPAVFFQPIEKFSFIYFQPPKGWLDITHFGFQRCTDGPKLGKKLGRKRARQGKIVLKMVFCIIVSFSGYFCSFVCLFVLVPSSTPSRAQFQPGDRMGCSQQPFRASQN